MKITGDDKRSREVQQVSDHNQRGPTAVIAHNVTRSGLVTCGYTADLLILWCGAGLLREQPNDTSSRRTKSRQEYTCGRCCADFRVPQLQNKLLPSEKKAHLLAGHRYPTTVRNKPSSSSPTNLNKTAIQSSSFFPLSELPSPVSQVAFSSALAAWTRR